MRKSITAVTTYTTLTNFRNDIMLQLDASNYIWPRVGTWGWAKTRTKLAFELVQDMYNGGLGGPILTNPPHPTAQSTPASGAPPFNHHPTQSTLVTGASLQSPRVQPIPAPEAALQQRHEHSNPGRTATLQQRQAQPTLDPGASLVTAPRASRRQRPANVPQLPSNQRSFKPIDATSLPTKRHIDEDDDDYIPSSDEQRHQK
jgi:hypothetical protein